MRLDLNQPPYEELVASLKDSQRDHFWWGGMNGGTDMDGEWRADRSSGYSYRHHSEWRGLELILDIRPRKWLRGKGRGYSWHLRLEGWGVRATDTDFFRRGEATSLKKCFEAVHAMLSEPSWLYMELKWWMARVYDRREATCVYIERDGEYVPFLTAFRIDMHALRDYEIPLGKYVSVQPGGRLWCTELSYWTTSGSSAAQRELAGRHFHWWCNDGVFP